MEEPVTENLLEEDMTMRGRFDTRISVKAETIVKEELIIEDNFNVSYEDECDDWETEEPETNTVVKEELIIEDNFDAFDENELEEELTAKKPVKIRNFLTCKECGKRFSVLALYQSHLQKHENIRLGTYRCSFCKESFGGARDRRIHIRMNHRTWDEEMRQCRHCGREFPDLKSFQCHVAWHKRRGLYCCSNCGENLISSDASETHVCPVVKKPKPKPSKLDLRYKFHCEECGKRFMQLKHYKSHVEKHEHVRKGTFQCDICEEHLGGKVELQKHKRIHAGVPEYMKSCQECGKEFSTPTAYHVHVSRHRKDSRGTIHCPFCDKNFATTGRLKFHKCPSRDPQKEGENSTSSEGIKKEDRREVNETNGPLSSYQPTKVKDELLLEDNTVDNSKIEDDLPVELNLEDETPIAKEPARNDRIVFQCEECGKRFSKEAPYRSHQQRHENIRNGTFRCPTCGQCQGSKRDLSEHVRDRHKPIPEWMQRCRECGREFSNCNSYRAHMTRHRNMRKGTYRCEACERCFLDKNKLKIHRCSVKLAKQPSNT